MRPVHPHARGDNVQSSSAKLSSSGPPPRAWGQLVRPAPACPLDRSTPTRVGTTGSLVVFRGRVAVHPHARGDNGGGGLGGGTLCGPPPRAWGQQRERIAHAFQGRSTPTRVGTTPRFTALPQSVPASGPHNPQSNGPWHPRTQFRSLARSVRRRPASRRPLPFAGRPHSKASDAPPDSDFPRTPPLSAPASSGSALPGGFRVRVPGSSPPSASSV